MGRLLIVNILIVIALNACVVASVSLKFLWECFNNIYNATMDPVKNEMKQENLLLEYYGPEMFPGVKRKLEEEKAIKFCKEFHPERVWCH